MRALALFHIATIGVSSTPELTTALTVVAARSGEVTQDEIPALDGVARPAWAALVIELVTQDGGTALSIL